MGLNERVGQTPIQRWEKGLKEIAPSTARTYSREFNQFLVWADETPEGLLKFWVDTKDDMNKMMNLSDHIISYAHELTEAGYKGGKQSSAICSIKKFFKLNGFDLIINMKNLVKGSGARVAKASEIEEALKQTAYSTRAVAIIAICKDSGLRVSDITRIQFKHIQNLIDNPEILFYGWQQPVWKTRASKRQSLPCLGIEGITHLFRWLEYRARYDLPTGPEDYVFVNLKNMNGAGKKCVFGERMDERNASWMVIKLFQKIGINDLSSNSLRKFNTTALSLSGMSGELVKSLHGKNQGSSEDFYLKATANQILTVYKEHYHSLTVDGQTELAQKNKTLEETNNMLIEKMAQMEATQKNMMKDIVAEAVEKVTRQLSEKSHWEVKRTPGN